jgi:hypothetical protein
VQPEVEPEPEGRPRPRWLPWVVAVAAVLLLLCCIGCGIELFRFFGWLSSTHPS